MYPGGLTRSCLALIIFSAVPSSYASSISADEVQTIRQVLRGLSIDEQVLSDSDLIRLSGEGEKEASVRRAGLSQEIEIGNITATCGAGTHGGDSDPRPVDPAANQK